ncbi:MAG: helix-turn-helix transcriptional regulator [Treponema sp.]|jgi:DNA-binding CsgD family transcriptional regulator|nr:helix-turn-helix transcriptional regulator [Treponema sp.]
MPPKVRTFPLLFTHLLLFFLFFPLSAFAQIAVASRIKGANTLYYPTLHEAFEATVGMSIDAPDEITLLADITVYEPLTVDEGKHIRLVPDGNRTIRRASDFLEYPVIWVNGEDASLSLGKPGMEGELTVDGGCLDTPPVEAQTPLVAVSGPDAKLVMYDKVVLQNNHNKGSPRGTSIYQNGAGVFIRTAGDSNQLAEFIMKGGTIRGNVNNLQNTMDNGGGVTVAGLGLFTMEGGVIMANTAYRSGGGLCVGSRGSFSKTGGVIYGKNAPVGYRNNVITGTVPPRTYGYAVIIYLPEDPSFQFRDDTVRENDRLSYAGALTGNGVFGQGEKWARPNENSRRYLLIAISFALAAGVVLILLIVKIRHDRKKYAFPAGETPQGAVIEPDVELTSRERQVFDLLLTDIPVKQIAGNLQLTYSGVNFHIKNLYGKLGIQSRTELLVKFRQK